MKHIEKIVASLGRGGRRLRIGYGRIFHEGCAFSPMPTTEADFRRTHTAQGAELARLASAGGVELKSFFPHAELTGFVHAAKLAGDVEAIPLFSALAVPGGPVTPACFEWLVSSLLERLAAAGALDGVYLALHGSMEVSGLDESPEAVILRRVRALVGPAVQIAASFDLHGNITPGVIEQLDLIVAYRSNPHWDLAPTGFRAGNRLIRALRQQVRPVKAWRKLPLVLGGGTTVSFLRPMRAVFTRMKRLERDPRVLATSLFMVHPYTSSTELGWSVHVLTDGDEALAERLADELADLAWEAARTPIPKLWSIDEALDEAQRSAARRLGPITLVDTADIVGAGAPGGSTQILEALLQRRSTLRALVPVHDPSLYARLVHEPLGVERSVEVRGTPGYDQPPVALRVRVMAKSASEFGERVRVDAGPIHLVIAANPPLPIHPGFWRELQLDPRRADVMVQKNFFHYRLFYAAISFRHLPVASRGATNLARVTELPQRVASRPTVDLRDWREGDRLLRGLSRAHALR